MSTVTVQRCDIAGRACLPRFVPQMATGRAPGLGPSTCVAAAAWGHCISPQCADLPPVDGAKHCVQLGAPSSSPRPYCFFIDSVIYAKFAMLAKTHGRRCDAMILVSHPSLPPSMAGLLEHVANFFLLAVLQHCRAPTSAVHVAQLQSRGPLQSQPGPPGGCGALEMMPVALPVAGAPQAAAGGPSPMTRSAAPTKSTAPTAPWVVGAAAFLFLRWWGAWLGARPCKLAPSQSS